MDFCVEYEITVIRKGVKHVSGPCLMCDREMRRQCLLVYPLGISHEQCYLTCESHVNMLKACQR
jgi:hypothetical protein